MVVTLLEMTTTDFVMLSGSQRDLMSRLSGIEVHTSQGLTVGVTLGSGTALLFCATLLHTWIGRVVMGLLESTAAAVQQEDVSAPLRHDSSTVEEGLETVQCSVGNF